MQSTIETSIFESGDSVLTTVALVPNRRRPDGTPDGVVVPAGTVGIVHSALACSALYRVDFGDLGLKYVTAANLRLLDLPPNVDAPHAGDPLYLWDLVVDLVKECRRLQGELSNLLKNEAGAQPRLARSGPGNGR